MSKLKTPQTPQTPHTTHTSHTVYTVETSRTSTNVATLIREELAKRLTPNTRFQVQLGVTTSELDAETIVVDLLRNQYLRLNATGSFIWKAIKQQDTLSTIVSKIVDAFDADSEEAKKSATEFLADLVERGVITASTLEESSYDDDVPTAT